MDAVNRSSSELDSFLLREGMGWVQSCAESDCHVQGTAATAVAGIYGALAVQGKPVEAITEQRFVVVGAGSAGMGVVQTLALGMVKHVSSLNHKR